MKRDRCIVCGAELFKEPIYVCKNMPAISQNLPTKDDLEKDKPVDLELCQCSGCGLVQFNNAPVPYYRESTRAGERCNVLIELRRKQYKHLIETYNLQGKKLIEFGTGKGGFLKTLKEMSEYHMEEFGIEYNPDFVKYAQEVEGVNVQQGNPECADTIISGAPFDAFTSFAYPARLVKPNEMMRCIYNNTTDDAVGIIMVPSMEHLLSAAGYYDIVADHIAYYDMDSLKFLVQINGFEILETGEVAGLYIYAYIRKRRLYDLNTIWSGVQSLNNTVSEYVSKEKALGRKIAVWCAGHFAFTVLANLDSPNDIEYIIDNADFKKGKYSPATHIPIVGPEYFANHPVDVIMILGPIYVDEIIEEIYCKCSNRVKILSVDKKGLHFLENSYESI